jgi:two-component system chemotaxis response regulator CheB
MNPYPPFRVLVAEDSATARALLVEILGGDSEIEVIGEAANGIEAVDLTRRLQPHVVTMDIRMPTMDGFEATRRIMIEAPTPIVIISGIADLDEVETSMRALQLGALAVLPKPLGPESAAFEEKSARLVQTVKAMAQVKVVRRWPECVDTRGPAWLPRPGFRARPRVVAIVASTGGPGAIAHILRALAPDFDFPILVVQHIAGGFVEGFAAWLNMAAAPRRVKVAQDGEPLHPGTVYVAPEDRHLGVNGNAIALSDAPPIDGFRPSGTHLFESVARAFGRATVAVILTGMGTDGVAGLRAVRLAGGRIIAQDEDTSVVFGMPGAAVASGLVDDTLPLSAIAGRLLELTAS